VLVTPVVLVVELVASEGTAVASDGLAEGFLAGVLHAASDQLLWRQLLEAMVFESSLEDDGFLIGFVLAVVEGFDGHCVVSYFPSVSEFVYYLGFYRPCVLVLVFISLLIIRLLQCSSNTDVLGIVMLKLAVKDPAFSPALGAFLEMSSFALEFQELLVGDDFVERDDVAAEVGIRRAYLSVNVSEFGRHKSLIDHVTTACVSLWGESALIRLGDCDQGGL
jgi:hypothetical protein